MSKKTISARDKISVVILYLEGNDSQHQLTEQSGVSLATIQQWIRNYESMDDDSFLRYYGKRFTDKETLVKMIEVYIAYYNSKRLRRNIGVLTPMEKHELYLQAT